MTCKGNETVFKLKEYVRFQVLTEASMKMTAFSDIAKCSLIEVDGRFRDAYCLLYQGDEGGCTHL
jgi:hypothetical protein